MSRDIVLFEAVIAQRPHASLYPTYLQKIHRREAARQRMAELWEKTSFQPSFFQIMHDEKIRQDFQALEKKLESEAAGKELHRF